MTGMTPERLDEIRLRAEAATEGPWHSHDFGHAGEEEPSSIVVHVGSFDHSDLLTWDTETAVAWMPRWERQESDNALFIAHARADVPDLLAEVERLRAVAAKAWDEGHTAGVRNASAEFDGPVQDNPYSPCAYCGGSGTVMVHERYGNGGGSNSAIACRWCEAGESDA